MHPQSTIYRLADDTDEMVIAALPQGNVARQFPTVVAERDGELIGYLGTLASGEMLIAGPLEVLLPEQRARGIVAMRLIEAYEVVLMQVEGVDHYYFTSDDPDWIKATNRCTRTVFCDADENGLCLFRRSLPRTGQPTVH